MDYELAQKLKDAGFPQKYHHLRVAVASDAEPVVVPTLSELIEACGDDFEGLERTLDCWKAYSDFIEEIDCNYLAEGKIPEEAVANLWLALKGL